MYQLKEAMSTDTAIHRAIEVLDAVASSPQGVSFSEARRLLGDISPTTVSRILRILCETRVLHQKEDKRYVFGERIESWMPAGGRLSLAELCRPYMQGLSGSLQTGSILWKRAGDQMMVLHKETHPNAPSLMYIGAVHPIGFQLIGGVFFMEDRWDDPKGIACEVAKSGFKKAGVTVIRKMIEIVKEDDLMDDFCAFYPGNYRLAIPLRQNGDVIAALGIGIMRERLDDSEFRQQVITDLKEVRQKLQTLLNNIG